MDSKYTINKINNNYNNKTNNTNNNDDNNKNNDNNDNNNKHNDLNDKNLNNNLNFHNNTNNLDSNNSFNNNNNKLTLINEDYSQTDTNKRNHNFEIDFDESTDSEKDIQQQKSKRGTIHYCNLMSCRKCHPDNQTPYRKSDKSTQAYEKRLPRAKWCQLQCKTCLKKLERIENLTYQWVVDNLNSKPTRQTEQENTIMDEPTFVNTDLNKLKGKELKDYELIHIRKDGNCLYRAILEACKVNQSYHMDLRALIMHHLSADATIDDSMLNGLTKEKYVALHSRSAKFAGYIELIIIAKLLKSWIAIHLEDDRYNNKNKWLIIKHDEISDPAGIIYLTTWQGNDPLSNIDATAHYNALRANQTLDHITNKLNELLEINVISTTNNPINILLWNCRSISDNIKKLYLLEELRTNNITIASLI